MNVDGQAVIGELVANYGSWFSDAERLADGKMTDRLYPYTHLFSPLQVNHLKLKNRLIMGPIGNIGVVEETGRPSLKMLAYFEERAKGGVGLITSGLVPVSQNVEAAATELGGLSLLPRIDRSRTVFPGWRVLAERVHAHGARFFIQLTPGLGRVGSPECLVKKFRLPVSASWNPSFYMPAVPCRPLRDDECWKIIKNAGQAAADAKALLIDGVYLHGHEGYLLEQMTNPAFNRRAFGNFKDWQAFGVELVKHVRARTDPRYPLMYRIDLSLALNETYGERMRSEGALRKFANERTVAMTLDYMVNLVKAGVDMFDVDLGCYDNWFLPHPPGPMPPGAYLAVAKLVKDHFARLGLLSNAGQAVPVAAVGKLGYPDLAERALREGYCDAVMLARPLLADPEWPQKAYAGRVAEIRPCIGDQEGCLNEFIEGGHPQCTVNPRTGHEDVLSAELPPAAIPKQVAVVGAGPAGILCACTAAERGHRVTLYEKRESPGGELVPGSTPKIKFDVANYLQYLHGLLARTAAAHALEVRCGVEATPALLKGEGFDAVVTCTGARAATPRVPGVDLPHVVQAVDLLRDPGRAATAERMVVVGGGAVGCETALMLAVELGKQVTVVEMLPYLMKGNCTANRGYMIHYLEQAGVKLLNCTRLLAVGEGNITVARNASPTVPDPYNTWSPVLPENVINPLAKKIEVDEVELVLSADLVVLATGMVSEDALYEACVRERVAPEVHNIGDAFGVGRIFEATRAGYAVGRAL